MRRRPRQRARIARQLDAPDERRVEFALLQRAHRHRQRVQPRRVLARNRVTRTAQPKLPREPARHDPAQRAHRAIRIQRRPRRRAQFRDPAREFLRR